MAIICHLKSLEKSRQQQKTDWRNADFNRKKIDYYTCSHFILTQNLDLEFGSRLSNQMQFHAEQTFKMHSFRQEGWKLQLLHIQYIDFYSLLFSSKKSCQGKNQGSSSKKPLDFTIENLHLPRNEKRVSAQHRDQWGCYGRPDAYVTHTLVKLTPSPLSIF